MIKKLELEYSIQKNKSIIIIIKSKVFKKVKKIKKEIKIAKIKNQ